MADYAIGDVQGCYDSLLSLLNKIHFNEHDDRLWFVGDLVNRGPHSLEVLRLIKELPLTPRISLGNHDLHLLSKLFSKTAKNNADDTLAAILAADDREELGHWLRKQPLLHYDNQLKFVMCHAGIAPMWSLEQAKSYASEVESVLSGEYYTNFLDAMYGNDPAYWSSSLAGITRLRCIVNYFTRMRFCNDDGGLVFDYKGDIHHAPATLYPWYAVPKRLSIEADINLVFGHWAALGGLCPVAGIYAIDTGCLWGGQLTTLRLQDKQRFQVSGFKPA